MGRLFTLAALSASLCACVFGARGERTFSEERNLAGADTLRIALPHTPLPVTACDPQAAGCSTRMRVEGIWFSVAGTQADAKRNTEKASLFFEIVDGFAQLSAVKDLEVQDLVDLEITSIRVPNDVDLELFTSVGDVDVTGTSAAVSVEIDVGDVTIENGDGAVLVRNNLGNIDVQSDGIIDLHGHEGHATVVQTGAARDAYIFLDAGDIDIELSSDANLDLWIAAPGRIDVKTDAINTISSGVFARKVGNGTHHVELATNGGSVRVRLADGAGP